MENKNENLKCTILVSSCYSYRDVLYNFEYFFMKNWKDCPFKIILNIDEPIENLSLPYDEVVISKHKENLIRMRDVKIDTPYVILLQDDHFIFDKVDTKAILECINYAEEYQCGNLRLIQDPKTDVVFDLQKKLLEYIPGKAYRISARGGLWKTEYLQKFIFKYKDFWEMEQHGQSYSCTLPDKVLCTKYRVLPIMDAVHKGFYEDFACMLLEANEIEPKRTQMSSNVKMREAIKTAIWEINPDMIAKIQDRIGFGHKQKY